MPNDFRPQVPPCLILDIDGTLVEHLGSPDEVLKGSPKVLPGVREKFAEWARAGCKLILVTGRRESLRRVTERHLEEAGLVYDQLVMDAGTGTRVLVNDMKPGDGTPTAFAVNVSRGRGLAGLTVAPGLARDDTDGNFDYWNGPEAMIIGPPAC